MSKRRRRSPHSKPVQKPAVEKKTGFDFAAFSNILIWLLAIVLAGTPFVMGKYLEFNTPGPFDSGSYVYSAQHIAEGAKLGVDEIASARPMTLLVNFIGVKIFGFSETGPIVIQGLLQFIALVLVFIAVRKMYGSFAGIVSAVLAAFFLSSPLIAKFGNVKEQFMIAFMMITAACYILRQLDGKWWWACLTGAAAINIYYFKQTGLSVVMAIVVYMIVSIAIDLKQWRKVCTDLLLILAGAYAGIIPLCIFYAWQDSLTKITGKFPGNILVALLQLAIAVFVIFAIYKTGKKKGIWAKLKNNYDQNKKVWIGAVVFVVIVFATCTFLHTSGKVDFGPAAKIAGYPVKVVKGITSELTKLALKALGTGDEGYLVGSREMMDFKTQTQKVFRFYYALRLPVLMALVSIGAGLVVLLQRIVARKQTSIADRMVLFLAVWWILDMLFVWISPRSYEQYYLPLVASAAVLGGYICYLYSEKLKTAANKLPWYAAGAAGVFVMIVMSWHIYFGFNKSPHTGDEKKNKRYGYAQSLKRVENSKKGAVGPWEVVGSYINKNSKEGDKIYVWGWYPGIYVKAQRLSSAKKAFESEMHVKSPEVLRGEIKRLLDVFKQQPPKYIVDSQKRHFPWNRPQLELWPTRGDRKGLIPNRPTIVRQFDSSYGKWLTKNIDATEAARFKEMSAFRNFVMNNYDIVEPKYYGRSGSRCVHRRFGTMRVFKLKNARP